MTFKAMLQCRQNGNVGINNITIFHFCESKCIYKILQVFTHCSSLYKSFFLKGQKKAATLYVHINLSLPVWKSFWWFSPLWRPRRGQCRGPQASGRLARKRCCQSRQGFPHWSPQRSCRLGCSLQWLLWQESTTRWSWTLFHLELRG